MSKEVNLVQQDGAKHMLLSLLPKPSFTNDPQHVRGQVRWALKKTHRREFFLAQMYSSFQRIVVDKDRSKFRSSAP